jgi:hypothetical protein
MLPRTLKLNELWEIAFRLTKGRYSNFELQHRISRLSYSLNIISSVLNPVHPVFITPLELKTPSNTKTGTEELCLVKV